MKKIIMGLLLLLCVVGCGQPAVQEAGATTTTTVSGGVTTTTIPSTAILPADLTYLGAFRLPASAAYPDTGWGWGGTGAAYYSSGDPGGAGDGYPGSLYGIGHDHTKYVAETSIPVPVISASKDLSALNTASMLRDFTNIRSGISALDPLFADVSQLSRADLAILPALGSQTSPKLYSCWGVHFQSDAAMAPSHCWCDLDLTNHQGAWWVLAKDELTLYSTNDYLFEIPEAFANAYLSGRRLATGRYRDGGWGGFGPSLFAIAPWAAGDPPSSGTVLPATTLIRYPSNHPDGYLYGRTEKMNNYLHCDEWSGGAWLTAGSKSAVIFIGTKGTGTTEAWYGFSNGVRYPINEPPEIPIPPYPPAPYDDRGWWASSFEAQMIFYKPSDLAAVAQGTKQSYQVQPYATLSLDPYLFNIAKTAGLPSQLQKQRLGACTYDSTNHLLYIFEYRGDAENDRPLVHVFRITGF
jgi:hypothetical protein